MANILIADDHDLVRDTIAAYLESVEDFSVVSAASFSEVLEVLAGDRSIDVAILDYNMPGMSGLAGIRTIARRYPKTRSVLISGVASRDVATEAMDLGASGFIPKSMTATSMVNALRFVLAGEKFFPFDYSTEAQKADAARAFPDLTEREMQTLEFLCQGHSNKEIARSLGLQEVTVKLHVKNILAKLGVSNRTQAALMAKERMVF